MTHAQADPAVAGLSSEQVAQRVARGEVNVDAEGSGRSLGQIVRANVFTRINAILGVFLVLVIVTGSYRNGLFGLILIINSGIGIFQEVRAKRTLEQLSIIGEAKPSVRRDGTTVEVLTEELVLDDIVLLAPGDQVVVDGDVVEVNGLTVDESLLTGESDAIHKQVGDQVKSGSFVVAGAGAFRVTHVGADAYAAQLAKQAGEFTLVKSQLRAGIDSILKVVTYLLIPTGILVITNQLLVAKHSSGGWRDPILGMVGALVPMVPEGLILLTTVAFAVGVVRLGRRNCLVNELPAIEGLARVDVVCADKTGTLTEPGMQVDRIEPLTDEPAEPALAALAAADPNPNASMAAIAQAYPHSPGWEITGVAPFDSAKKWSGVSFGADGNWLLGAPDILLPTGSADARRAEEIGSTGLRLLLIARSDIPVDDARAPGTVTPVALVALRQKVRPDARGALDYFASQGVSLKVISGDNATSVGAVAASLGLGDPDRAVDARQLPEQQSALADAVEQGTVFGRVLPDQKRAMVHALQSRKHTVAMTGDGVNDVLALKDADVGVAMGSGSSASRSVAQIVLLDNKFATLPSVVGEGRRVIGNIERVSRLYLTKTIYAVTLAFLIGVFGLGARFLSLPDISYPFQPIHITIAGWFTIGIPSFVLSLAPNNERAQDGFVRRVLRLSVPSGLAVALSTFVCYLLVRPGGSSGIALGSGTDTEVTTAQLQASTATLVTLIGSSLWVLVVIARPLVPWKVGLIAICFVAYVPIFGIPWLRREFLLDPTNTRVMLVGAVFAAVGAALVEIVQRVIQRRAG